MTANYLQETILGLSAYLGILLVPLGRSWFAILAKLMESNRPSLTPKQAFSWLLISKTLLFTGVFGFIGFNWQLAARELTATHANLGIYSATLLGFLLGVLLWCVYAIVLRILRPDWQSFYKKFNTQRLFS